MIKHESEDLGDENKQPHENNEINKNKNGNTNNHNNNDDNENEADLNIVTSPLPCDNNFQVNLKCQYTLCLVIIIIE